MRSVPQSGFSWEIRPMSVFSSALRRAEPSSGLPCPIEPPTLPVPAQDRLRPHHMEVLSPILRPDMAKPEPEDSIRSPELGMRVGTQRDLELMAEDQVLEREIPARSNGSNEGASTSKSNSGIRQDSNSSDRRPVELDRLVPPFTVCRGQPTDLRHRALPGGRYSGFSRPGRATERFPTAPAPRVFRGVPGIEGEQGHHANS
jgi:hypothetical protein